MKSRANFFARSLLVASLSLAGAVLIVGCAAQQSPPTSCAQQGLLYRVLRYDYRSNEKFLSELDVARSFLRRYSGSPVLANADPSLAEWTQWADRAADWLIHQKDREQIEQEFDRLSSRSPSPTGGSVDAADLATMPQGSDNGPAMALAGKPAPAFTLKDLEGKSVELGQLKGSVVVLDFWATWCGPCVQSLPHIAELSREQGPKGLKVFAVNQQEGEAEVKQFLSAHRDLNDLTVLLDSNGAVGAKYLANAIPETVVIGKDGVIKKVFVGAGPGTAQQIHAAVASLSLGGGVLITGCAAQQSPPAPSAQQGELYRILRYDYSSNRQALFQLVMARDFLRRYGGSPVLANADPSLAEWTQWAERAADWLIHQKDRDRIEREFDLMTIRSPSPTGGSVATTSDWQHFLQTKTRLPLQVYLQWVEAGILGDGQRMMALSAQDNAVDAQLAELYRDNAFAVARFRKSVDAKFGPGAIYKLDASKIAVVGIRPGLLNEPLEENINGDDATLKDKEYTIVLKKIDGVWKLRISSMGSITSGQSLAIASEVIHTSTTAWDRLTKAIEDGEITSIEELRQLL